MKVPLSFVAGVCVGIVVSLLVVPSGWRHWYQTKSDLLLTDNHGERAGVVPAGTRILAKDHLEESLDFGWTGCVPVQFESMTAAREAGVVSATKLKSIVDVTLNASLAQPEPAKSEGSQSTTEPDVSGTPEK